MSEVAIIINVNKKDFVYRRGPLGTYIVPGKGAHKFGMLVVREASESQDIGSQNVRMREAIPARLLTKDILGEKGLKLGLFVCEADPDVPKSLLKAEAAQKEYLADHPGKVEQTLIAKIKMRVVETIRSQRETEQIEKLAATVSEETEEFNDYCKKLVKPAEIAKATENLTNHYKDLCKEADVYWSVENTRKDVGIHHQEAAQELGYEPVWASTPSMKAECPACGAKIKPDIAMCPSCHAILDEAKARKFWPEKFAAPAA